MDQLEKFYQYFDLEISAWQGSKRAEFIQAIRDDLKPCKVVSVRELFTEEQVRFMKSIVEPKQCFKNAYSLAYINIKHPDGRVKYVEGRALVANFLPIEHAWNCIGDKYFDATFELALGKDVTTENYALLAEYGLKQVTEIILERKYWGEIYREEKFKHFLI